jgi:hypothetical protein
MPGLMEKKLSKRFSEKDLNISVHNVSGFKIDFSTIHSGKEEHADHQKTRPSLNSNMFGRCFMYVYIVYMYYIYVYIYIKKLGHL